MSEDLTIRTVMNPLNETFYFKWDGKEYEIPANTTKAFVGYLAGHAAKHLAKKILQKNGRFADQMHGDTRVYNAVTTGEIVEIMNSLVDRDDKELDISKVMEKAKGLNIKEVDDTLLKGDQGESDKVEIQNPQIGVTEKEEFENLKKIGYTKLKADQKKRYAFLKKQLENNNQ